MLRFSIWIFGFATSLDDWTRSVADIVNDSRYISVETAALEKADHA